MTTRTRATLGATAALLLALTACGSDGDSGTGGSNSDNDPFRNGGTEQEIRAAVEAHFDAINNGDGAAAYAALSTRCRELTTETEIQQGIDLINELYGEITLETLDISDITDDSAHVLGTTGIDALDDGAGARWIREDDAWHADDCDEGASEEPAADPLAVGETHTWPDQVAVTVDSVTEVTEFGEYDPEVTNDETAFRIALTVTNDSDQPIDLSEIHPFVEGATNGGEAGWSHFEAGAREIAGRLAAGVQASFTWDGVLENQYGRDLIITVQRLSDDNQDPEWAVTIE